MADHFCICADHLEMPCQSNGFAQINTAMMQAVATVTVKIVYSLTIQNSTA